MKTRCVVLRNWARNVHAESVGEATGLDQDDVHLREEGIPNVLDGRPEALNLSSSFVVRDSNHR